MKQKIAVCISGIPRLYSVSYASFKKHIIDINVDYDFDFFLYIKTDSKNTAYYKYNIDRYNYDINDIINTYKPKNYVVDNLDKSKKDILNELTQQCDNVINCIKLKIDYEQKNNVKYDYVIKYRFDLYTKEDYILQLPQNINECVIANANQDLITMYCSHFVNLDMQNVEKKHKSLFISILRDLQKNVKISPISDIYFICKSDLLDNIVKYKHINWLIKKELPEAYYEIIFFSILYMCGINTYIDGYKNYYCLHQVFCNNKHLQWNILELNNLKNQIIDEYPNLCSHELYKIVLLL
jgi:hypothetical protein